MKMMVVWLGVILGTTVAVASENPVSSLYNLRSVDDATAPSPRSHLQLGTDQGTGKPTTEAVNDDHQGRSKARNVVSALRAPRKATDGSRGSERLSGGDSVRLARADGISSGAEPTPSEPERETSDAVYDRPAVREVIVTAQKYQQPVFDVPMSLAVIGGAELQRLPITDLASLQSYVPGLTVDSNGPSSRYIAIRGISNLSGQGPVVGTYLDEADVTTNDSLALNLSTYDLERVEVLRGPQGTLYGEGSVGGTIRYITNRPDLARLQMKAYLSASFDQYGAPGERIEAVVNVPIVQSTLGLRFALNRDHEGGWVDQPAANLKNINGTDVTDARVEGRWKPAEDLTIDATQVVHSESAGPWTGEDAKGNFTQAFGLTTTPVVYDRFNMTNLTVQWDAGYVRLLNTATYFKHDNDARNQGFIGYEFALPPAPTLDFYSNSRVIDENVSDEFRASDLGTGPWRWTLGVYYKRFTDHLLPTLGYFGVPGPPGTLPASFSTSSDSRDKAKSAFADTNYKLLGKLVVGVGVRYFRDEESVLPGGSIERQSRTFSSVDPRVYLRYALSKHANAYASAAKGFRSGGLNATTPGAPPYQPERVWTYELGLKTRSFDNRLSADTDVFFSTYAGYQIYGVALPPNPPLDVLRNAGTARIKGVETALTWRFNGKWLVGIGGDYIDARFVNINALATAYAVGDPLDLTPRYQITATVERDFDLAGKEAYVRMDFAERAREMFRNRSIAPWYYSRSDNTHLLSVKTAVDVTSTAQLGLFVQNLLNDRGYTGADVIEDAAARLQPRTFGLEFAFEPE